MLILEEVESHGFEGECLFSIRLALEEAIINAIRHGNKFDESKPVDVTYTVTDEKMEVTIVDQGEGFDPDDVPDPTADENLENPSGRGVMLIRTFMDEVEYTKNGCSVRMVKYRDREGRDECCG